MRYFVLVFLFLSACSGRYLVVGAQTQALDLIGEDAAALISMTNEIWHDIGPGYFACDLRESVCIAPRQNADPWRVSLSADQAAQMQALVRRLWPTSKLDLELTIECQIDTPQRCVLKGGVLRALDELTAGSTIVQINN